MFRRCLIAAIAYLCFAPPCRAQTISDDQLFEQAKTAFVQGKKSLDKPAVARRHFVRAADLFGQLHERGVRNAQHYLNQGNAELLADQIPQAILSYRRGLKLAPHDAALQSNLYYARKQVDTETVAGGNAPNVGWPPSLPYVGLPQVFALAGLTYVGGCLCWMRWWMARRSLWLSLGIVTSVAFIACGAASWWLDRQIRWEGERPIVVIARDTRFYCGNGASYDPHQRLSELRRGMEARLMYQRGAWVQIQFASGEIGWVPRETVLVE